MIWGFLIKLQNNVHQNPILIFEAPIEDRAYWAEFSGSKGILLLRPEARLEALPILSPELTEASQGPGMATCGRKNLPF